MPELRLQKARESLPSGYRYGDAAKSEWDVLYERYVNPVLAMTPDDWARHHAKCPHGFPADTCVIPNWLTSEVREKLSCR